MGTLLALLLGAAAVHAPSPSPRLEAAAQKAKAALVAKFGETQRGRIERGVNQVLSQWRDGDGDAAAFSDFVQSQFVADPKELDALFHRFEENLEQVDGGFVEMNRWLGRWSVLDLGPMIAADPLFGALDMGAHENDDLFAGKLAFVALLNWPLTTLEERARLGGMWSRQEWAEARLTGRFALRVPATVNQAIAKASADAELYIADYNIFMHHVLAGDGSRLFPRGMKLISHWNLRDELKADYADKEHGLAKQRAIEKVMERIVTQTIPEAVVNDPAVDWNPFTNAVTPSPPGEIDGEGKPPAQLTGAREPDTRYATLLETFHAARLADPWSPRLPTMIDRKFELERELPEARVKALLESIVGSPLARRTAALVQKRLGRPLEPFDIWYDGFRPRSQYDEAQLDAITRKKYPTPQAYKDDIPNLLVKLGFTPEKAQFLAGHIVVDPARGAGHALGAGKRGDDPHLRTRVEKDGMNYKGYNIAVHEMGHNVEQVFSLYEVDHTLLAGVPNTAFTEALAFVFQRRDLELLGLEKPGAESERLDAVNAYWMSFEIAGVGLVDLAVWHWMYDHPKATPAQLREATLQIAKDTWNKWYAPVLGQRDVPLLGIYSHMISSFMYLPDYTIGYVIQAQIEQWLDTHGPLGAEFERMASYGQVTPDLWMKHATGQPVSAGPLLDRARAALDAMEKEGK